MEGVDESKNAGLNKCEEIFQKTTNRGVDNKFVVRLPIKEDVELGDSGFNAYKRFSLLEKRFVKITKLKTEYFNFLKEYLEINQMEFVRNIPDEKDIEESEGIHYISHHAIFKESSTTRLRVVFDASAKTSTGNSLNDKLMVGPLILENILSILLRFRTYNIILIGDLEKDVSPSMGEQWLSGLSKSFIEGCIRYTDKGL